MSSWSAFRRSSPSIRRFSAIQLLQFRRFSAAPDSAHFQSTSQDNRRTNILGWISAGIITSSTLAFSLYSFSSSSYVAFADCASPSPGTTLDGLPQPSVQNQTNESKFLFGGKGSRHFSEGVTYLRIVFSFLTLEDFWCYAEAYRRRIFFNYEKRIRMRSPPEKVFISSRFQFLLLG